MSAQEPPWPPAATRAARGPAPSPAQRERAGGEGARGLSSEFKTGLLTNVFNPKVALFFLAFLPQFVPAATPSATLSFLLLGGWFVVQGFAFLLLLVALASRLRRVGASPPLRRALAGCGGLLFIGLALRLALGERPQLR